MTQKPPSDAENRFSESDLNKLKGMKLGKTLFRVKGKGMVRYAKSLNVNNPKYIPADEKEDGTTDYSTVFAHPSIGGMFSIQGMFALADASAMSDSGKKMIICKNVAKTLHTGQKYSYRGCKPIKAGDKLSTQATIDNAYFKGDLLFVDTLLETVNQNNELVLKTTLSFAVRPGGYGYA